jgi:hypothetical protein
MKPTTKAIQTRIVDFIGDAVMPLSPAEYLDLLEELQAHIAGLIDCVKEEQESED